jgi:PhnB protein
MKAQFPLNQWEKIIHASLKQGAVEITASDWFHPTRTLKQGNTVCLYISEGTFDELRTIFEKLSRGAEPNLLDPLKEMSFGSYGALTDQFGVRWMFQGERRAKGS